jgi:hypothetical protein
MTRLLVFLSVSGNPYVIHKGADRTITEAWKMGDEPGHIRATFELKGIGIRYAGPSEPPYKIDCWGVGEYFKDGTGSDRGHCKFTFADGSYYYEEFLGKAANGRDVGTAIYYGGGGGGRFKGMKGAASSTPS